MIDHRLPDRNDLESLGREMIAQSAAAFAKARAAASPAAIARNAIAKADDRWAWNREVYEAQLSHPDQGIHAEDFGLEMADRREPRGSWQAGMSESGEPLGSFGRAFSLLAGIEVEDLRKAARTSKGRKRLQMLSYWLRQLAP